MRLSKKFRGTIILNQLLVLLLCSGDTRQVGDDTKSAGKFNVTRESKTVNLTTTQSTFDITLETNKPGSTKNISLDRTDSPARHEYTTQSALKVPSVDNTLTTKLPSHLSTNQDNDSFYDPYSTSCDNDESLQTALAKVKDCTTYKPDLYSCKDNCGNKTSKDRHCACDLYCLVNDDCCDDFTQICPTVAATSREIMDSVQGRQIHWNCIKWKHDVPVKMITTCLDENNTPCDLYDLDLLEGHMPVFDNNTGLYYLNNYCAKCNNFTTGNLQLPTNVTCKRSQLGNVNNIAELQQAIYNGECELRFDKLGHQCWEYRSTCHQDCENKTVEILCKDKSVQMYSIGSQVYKNEYCAICANSWPRWFIHPPHCNSYSYSRDVILKGFSFSFLMNINPDKGLLFEYEIDGKKRSYRCNNLTDCRDACITGYELQNDTCVLVYHLESIKVSFEYIIHGDFFSDSNIDISSYLFLPLDISEALTKIREGETSISFSKDYDTDSKKLKGLLVEKFTVKFSYINNLTLHQFHNDIVDIIINSTKENIPVASELETLIICVELVNYFTCYDWLNDTVLYQRIIEKHGLKSLEIMAVVTIVCLGLSIMCMLIRLIFQPFVSIYHSFSGKIQFIFVSSLCAAHILYLIGPFAIDMPNLCKAIGILIHYFFLVSFTWMAIIALDMYLTFRSMLCDSKGWKHIFVYTFISMFLPAIVISVAIILDHVSIVTRFKPLYSNSMSDSGTCLMSNPYAVLVFFAAPLGVMIVFNIIMYTLTVFSLRNTWKQTTMVSKDNKSHFYIYIKIFIIMGFTWIFGFIGPFVHDALEYVFIVLNASQGVFIFVATVCTKTVLNELKAKCRPSTDGSQGNQHTALTDTADKSNTTYKKTKQRDENIYDTRL